MIAYIKLYTYVCAYIYIYIGHPFIYPEFWIFSWDSEQTRQKEPNDFEALREREKLVVLVVENLGEVMPSARCQTDFLRKNMKKLWKKRCVFNLEPEPPFFWQDHSEKLYGKISQKWIPHVAIKLVIWIDLVDLMSWQFPNIQTFILKPSSWIGCTY